MFIHHQRTLVAPLQTCCSKGHDCVGKMSHALIVFLLPGLLDSLTHFPLVDRPSTDRGNAKHTLLLLHVSWMHWMPPVRPSYLLISQHSHRSGCHYSSGRTQQEEEGLKERNHASEHDTLGQSRSEAPLSWGHRSASCWCHSLTEAMPSLLCSVSPVNASPQKMDLSDGERGEKRRAAPLVKGSCGESWLLHVNYNLCLVFAKYKPLLRLSGSY